MAGSPGAWDVCREPQCRTTTSRSLGQGIRGDKGGWTQRDQPTGRLVSQEFNFVLGRRVQEGTGGDQKDGIAVTWGGQERTLFEHDSLGTSK